jgi:hypothetical protein
MASLTFKIIIIIKVIQANRLFKRPFKKKKQNWSIFLYKFQMGLFDKIIQETRYWAKKNLRRAAEDDPSTDHSPSNLSLGFQYHYLLKQSGHNSPKLEPKEMKICFFI